MSAIVITRQPQGKRTADEDPNGVMCGDVCIDSYIIVIGLRVYMAHDFAYNEDEGLVIPSRSPEPIIL